MTGTWIDTERLVMRSWCSEDLEPFHSICSDPVVMVTLGPVMNLEQTDALIDRVSAMEAEHGHTFWALERRADARLIGWCGVIRGSAGPVDGKAEIGWRLASDCWGQGYVSEAARATIDWLFTHLPDDTAWAITNAGNARSRAVMERLGMTYRPELDFPHPKLAEDDLLRPHVTYVLSRKDWAAQ